MSTDTPAHLRAPGTTRRGIFLVTLNAIVSPLVFAGVVAYGLRLTVGGFAPTAYELRELAICALPTMFGTWVALRREALGKMQVARIPPRVKAWLRRCAILCTVIGGIIGLSTALSAMERISTSAAEACHVALGMERDWSAPMSPEVKACLPHGVACRSAEDETAHDKVIYGEPVITCIRKRLGVAGTVQPSR